MKSEVYTQTVCDGRYHACCITDVDCFSYCEMPCPYDKEQSPCDMCDITCNEDVKTNCIALKTYTKRKS